jgi:penicillin-binding protein 1A
MDDVPLGSRSVLVASVLGSLALVAASCGIGDRNIPTLVPIAQQQTMIFAADGTQITSIASDENRIVVPLSQIPAILQNAVVSIEDERFWQHGGVDLRGIARAAKSNSKAGGVSEGGSTITQQYVKTVLLSPQRTLGRKIQEANLSLQVERTHSKTWILEQYLNTIFFGNRSYGVEVASQRYFGHDIAQITLPEAALLAGIIQAPSRYDPYRNPKTTTQRRNTVLDKMHQLGYITDAEWFAAKATPLEAQVIPQAQAAAQSHYPAPHFVEEVKRFIRSSPLFGSSAAERNDLLTNGGLRIYTTLDLKMQAQMEQAAEQKYPHQGSSSPDIGMVAIEPRTGYVKAMYGGYNFWDTSPNHSYAQVNLAVGGGRQVGSTFKAITLTAALASGISIQAHYPAPPQTVVKIPGFAPWPVQGDNLGNSASLENCLIQSANTCFANLIADPRVGPKKVTEFAAKMGINTLGKFKTVPSETLGTNNNTVLEMTGAYDTFANRGVFVPPTMITKVVRADGTVIYDHTHIQSKVLEPKQADDITTAMQGVLTEGTAKKVGGLAGRPSAGKTGTTESKTDAWFIGFTPDLVTGVWVGYSQPSATRHGEIGRLRTLPGYGADMAAPVWKTFMDTALAGTPPSPFGQVSLNPSGPTVVTTPPPTSTTVPASNTSIFEVGSVPKTVTMPTLTGVTIDVATSRAKQAGLKLQRVDSAASGMNPGQVVAQSPAPGSKVPSGSTIVVEATPGTPPPTSPVPNVVEQLSADAAASLRRGGWSVNTVSQPATAGYLFQDGTPPISGQVWQVIPNAGVVSTDGKVTIYVQP